MKSASAARGRDHLHSGQSMPVDRYCDRLLGRLDLPRGKNLSALDLGCGDGMEARYLAARGFRVDALDLEAHPRWPRLEKAWKGKIRFKTADAAQLGRTVQGAYDLVFQKDMLHHVEDPEAVLVQMKKRTRKGGRLAVLEVNRYNPISYVHLTLMQNHQHFTRRRLRELLAQAGITGYTWQVVEARVWPVENGRFQDWVEVAQDWLEKVPFLRPWLVYNLIQWSRP